MKNEIFTREDLEIAFSAGYDFAEDSFSNPDNTEYVNERVALKQANGAEQSDINCNIQLVNQQRELLLAFMQMREGHAVDTNDISLIDEFLKVTKIVGTKVNLST